jgi:hypothetical protein
MTYRRFSTFRVALISACCAVACSADPSGGDGTPGSKPPGTELENALARCSAPVSNVALGPEAGFVDVEGARLFYAFRPADQNPESAPLLVFTNGGAATSIFLPYGTGPFTLDPKAGPQTPPSANPSPHTRFANVLYFDARDRGFSYLTVRPEETCTADEVAIRDAGDLVHTVLDFLDTHESLVDNAVTLVGESYGGVRVTLALDFIRTALDSSRASVVEDLTTRLPWLTDRIDRHAEKAFSSCSADSDRRAALAAQFGSQVLVQPGLAGLIYRGLTPVEGIPDTLVEGDHDFSEVLSMSSGLSAYDVRRPIQEDQWIVSNAAAIFVDRVVLI